MSFSNSSTVPIEMLPGIGFRTAKVLRSLDIMTVGQFKRMPEKVLVELFGPSIKPVHNYVHNKKRKVIKKVQPQQNNKLSFVKKFQVAAQFMMML